jgi:hypothetical protein
VNDLEEPPRFDPATLGARLPGLQDHLRSLPEIETQRLTTSVHTSSNAHGVIQCRERLGGISSYYCRETA